MLGHSGANQITKIEVAEASVPISSFPRYTYMLKIRKDLASRYNLLMGKYNMKQFLLEENVSGDKIPIIFCKSTKCKDSLPDIKQIVPKPSETFSSETYKTNVDKIEKIIKTEFSTVEKNKGSLTCLKEFPKHICFIGNDIATTALSDIYTPGQKYKYKDDCPERIKRSLKTDLERYALSGMKKACEILQLFLEIGHPFEHYEREKRDVMKENVDGVSSNQRSRSAVLGMSMSFPVQPRPDNNGKPQSCVMNHTQEEGKCNNITIPKNITEEDREMIARLYEEYVGVFNRSILPEDEKPRQTVPRDISKDLLDELCKLDTSIESCGYSCSTLQVNVNTKDISAELKKGIADIMKRNRIANHSICSSAIKEFSSCNVGQEIMVKWEGEDRFGTLGGFGKTSSEDSECKWAILSQHVAKGSIDKKLYMNNDSNPVQIGKIAKKDPEGTENKPYLDIAAAALEKDISIDDKYVTEDENPVPGKLCSYINDPEKLRGLNVHIKGAMTPLGRGMLTMTKQISVKDGQEDCYYIKVKDRKKGVAFAQSGDSGAIVVAENPDKYGEEVQLISMVMGEHLSEKGSYNTVRIDKALEQLKSLTDKDFDMC